jgi:peptidoglycan hydrolase CwlO-like protein
MKWAIAILIFIGLIIAGYWLYNHYKVRDDETRLRELEYQIQSTQTEIKELQKTIEKLSGQRLEQKEIRTTYINNYYKNKNEISKTTYADDTSYTSNYLLSWKPRH